MWRFFAPERVLLAWDEYMEYTGKYWSLRGRYFFIVYSHLILIRNSLVYSISVSQPCTAKKNSNDQSSFSSARVCTFNKSSFNQPYVHQGRRSYSYVRKY